MIKYVAEVFLSDTKKGAFVQWHEHIKAVPVVEVKPLKGKIDLMMMDRKYGMNTFEARGYLQALSDLRAWLKDGGA